MSFPFGIDISDKSIKMVQLAKDGQFLSLANAGSLNLDSGLLENGKILDNKKLSLAIQDLLGRLPDPKTNYAIVSLPEEHVYIKIIHIPKISGELMKETIRLEAESNIPLPIESVYYDYSVVAKENNNLEIFLTAASRELVNDYLNVFKTAKVNILALESEVISLARAIISGFETPQTILIVDMGATRTGLVVFQGMAPKFSVTVRISGEQINKALIKTLNISAKQAEKIKKDIGFDYGKEDGKPAEAIAPIITRLKDEIRKYIDFYETYLSEKENKSEGLSDIDSFQMEKISKIILTGGESNLIGLNKFLSLSLKLPVENGNPWVNILRPPLKEVPKLSFNQSAAYSVALGLALRGFLERSSLRFDKFFEIFK